jgi:Uma2 family endonuclease
MAVAKAAGTWTYEDLVSLPDDGKRYEIIEGDLYEMPSPNLWHAATIMNLIRLLLPIIDGLKGQLYTASLDVFFPGADPVVPDILAILPHSRAVERLRGVDGPPDLVIEVLSPSNRSHDLLTKRALYGRAGVSEYWIVDPAQQSLDILTLDRDALLTTDSARGDGSVSSPLLGIDVSLARIFAGVGIDQT